MTEKMGVNISIFYVCVLIYLFLIDPYWSITASQYCQFLLHNKANEPHAYTYPLPLEPPSHPPYPTPLGITKHQANLPVPCCCFPPANYFMFSSVYMLMLLSLRPSFPLPPNVLKSIFYVYLFIPALQLGSSVPFFFFRFRIYALAYGIFLLLTYFTLYDRLQVHLPHSK